MVKLTHKIISIVTSVAILSQGLMLPINAKSNRPESRVLIGTPEQITKLVETHGFTQEVQSVISGEKVVQVKEISKDFLTKTYHIPHISITEPVEYTFSPDFATTHSTNEEQFNTVIKEISTELYNRIVTERHEMAQIYLEHLKEIMDADTLGINEADIIGILDRVVPITRFDLKIKIYGYACPLGGDIEKNKQLAKIRAQDAREFLQNHKLHSPVDNSIVEGGIAGVLSQMFLAPVNVRIDTEGVGAIFENTLVEQSIAEINNFLVKQKQTPLNYQDLLRSTKDSEFKKTYERLHTILHAMQNKVDNLAVFYNPQLYNNIKELLAPLRKTVFHIEAKTELKIVDYAVQVTALPDSQEEPVVMHTQYPAEFKSQITEIQRHVLHVNQRAFAKNRNPYLLSKKYHRGHIWGRQ